MRSGRGRSPGLRWRSADWRWAMPPGARRPARTCAAQAMRLTRSCTGAGFASRRRHVPVSARAASRCGPPLTPSRAAAHLVPQVRLGRRSAALWPAGRRRAACGRLAAALSDAEASLISPPAQGTITGFVSMLGAKRLDAEHVGDHLVVSASAGGRRRPGGPPTHQHGVGEARGEAEIVGDDDHQRAAVGGGAQDVASPRSGNAGRARPSARRPG